MGVRYFRPVFSRTFKVCFDVNLAPGQSSVKTSSQCHIRASSAKYQLNISIP
jgi:hypothetical protein